MTAHRLFQRAWFLAVALAGLVVTSVRAEERPLWELGLGLGALQLPHYRGSDQHHDLVLPVPYAIYRGKIFRATREGARAVLLDSERFDVDLSLAASAPVRSKDNTARAGMPDLAPTLEFGPNVNLLLGRGEGWKLDLRLPVRGVLQLNSQFRDAGYTVSPVVNLDLRWAGWNLGGQAGPLWASRRYNATYYDVSPLFATATRPAYTSTAGRGGWHWTTAATRRFGALWVGGYLNGDRLGGAVFDNSPLVRKQNTLSFGVALAWVFAVSDERVTSED
jgi:outer membrane scaffolding protein for murein synthesis (MipA/OmpV family)